MRDRIPVIGPQGLEARIINLYGCGDSPEPLRSVIDFIEFAATPLEFGPFAVEAQLVVHPVPAYALRITAGGRTLVYSGDTAPCDELVEISRGADLALFEASYLEKNDNPPMLHLTGADAAKAATAAGVSRLVLTHLVPWNDLDEVKQDALEYFVGDLIMARPGLTLTV
jgi:ribonuclease BN (tRNA processing enzyme)